jgi:phosphoserine phosphatase
VLATSSLDFIVAPLATHLGAGGILATTLQFVNGACTGQIAGTPMFRREKKNRVLAYLAQEGVAPSDCSFYSDSIYDLPLLEEVGRPVAVNPDFRLRRIARSRGWPILNLS